MINIKMFSMIEVMFVLTEYGLYVMYALTNEISGNIRDLVLFFVPDVSSFLP